MALTIADLERVVSDQLTSSLGTVGTLRIDKYDGEISWRCVEWINDFEETTKIKGWTDANRVDRFGGSLEKDAKNWYKLYVAGTDPPINNWNTLKDLFITYHLPKDRESYVREQMKTRKQRPNEEVSKYITHKLLLCREVNPNMQFEQIRREIFDGLSPNIRATIIHKDNPNIDRLLENARNIEEGLRSLPNHTMDNRVSERLEVTEKNVLSLCENMSKILTKLTENDKTKDRIRDSRSRERYVNGSYSRDNSRGRSYDGQRTSYSGNYRNTYNSNRYPSSDRNGYNNRYRDHSSDRNNESNNYRDDYKNRQQSRDQSRDRDSHNNGYNGRRGRSQEDRNRSRSIDRPSSMDRSNDKRVSFERSRNRNETVNIDGEPICYYCHKPGHIAQDCPNNVFKKPPQTPPVKRKSYIISSHYLDSKLEDDGLIYQSVFIMGVPVSALIDSGSVVSLIEAKLAKRLELPISPYGGQEVKAVNGSKLMIVGETEVPITITIDKTSRTALTKLGVVNDFDFNILLGNDFNKKIGLMIDCENYTVMLSKNSENRFVGCVAKAPNIRSIHAAENIILPPNEKVNIKVVPNSKRKHKQFTANIKTDPKAFEKNHIFIKENDIEFVNSVAFIPVVNCDSVPVKLNCGTIIGQYNPIREINNYIKYDKICGAILQNKNFIQIEKAVKTGIEIPILKADLNCDYCPFSGHMSYECPDRKLWYENHVYRNKIDIEKRKFDIKSVSEEINHLDKPIVNAIKISSNNKIPYFSDFEGMINYSPDLENNKIERLETLLNKYKQIFAFDSSNVGECNIIQFTVDTGDTKPIKQNPYRYSASQRDEINRQINKWVDAGIVAPCRSSWGSPVILVEKKTLDSEGKHEMRLCVDMRKVNNVTKKDVYPLPAVRDLLDALNGSVYFTLLDANCGFFQIRVSEPDQEKLAFITTDGLYKFLRMPFGCTNGPSTYQRAIDLILSGLKWNACVVYLDDILIIGKTFDKHLENLNLVLDRIRESGLTLNPKKCFFLKKSIQFLGHIVSAEGVSPDDEKVKAIKHFPRPQNITDVRSFIGLASYYRCFVKNFANIAQPMTSLNKKDVGFHWTDKQENAFNTLKDHMCSAPTLAHFDNKLPIELRCDGSFIGIGSILLHKIDNKYHVIRYDSRLLSNAEKNYIICEIECLAIVRATTKCQQYLLGTTFTIVSDHLSLKWLNTKPDLSPRLIRWAIHLQKFNFVIIYRSGRKMLDVDSLSRNPVDEPEPIEDNIERHCMLIRKSPEIIDGPIVSNIIPDWQKSDKNW